MKSIDVLNGRRRRPTHPGELLREDVLPATNLTQQEFANRLGVSRRTVSELLHERRPVTTDMALRLGCVLGNGPGIWLRMQQAVDVWDAFQEHKIDYQNLKPIPKPRVA